MRKLTTKIPAKPGWYYVWVSYGSPKKFYRATLELIKKKRKKIIGLEWKGLSKHQTVVRKVKPEEFVHYSFVPNQAYLKL